LFLLRAIGRMFARLSHGLQGVCLSFCSSVCHTAVLYQNGESYDHNILTANCHKDSDFFVTKFCAVSWGRERGVLS